MHGATFRFYEPLWFCQLAASQHTDPRQRFGFENRDYDYSNGLQPRFFHSNRTMVVARSLFFEAISFQLWGSEEVIGPLMANFESPFAQASNHRRQSFVIGHGGSMMCRLAVSLNSVFDLFMFRIWGQFILGGWVETSWNRSIMLILYYLILYLILFDIIWYHYDIICIYIQLNWVIHLHIFTPHLTTCSLVFSVRRKPWR